MRIQLTKQFRIFKTFAGIMFLMLFIAQATSSQTTEFTYQGSLKDGGNPANGNYDLEFVLFDALSAGTQLGSTQARNGVAVANGFFSVSLDFGNQFPGANRFLEVRVRITGGGAFTPLSPRQQVNSAPYTVKALNTDNAATATNATQLGGVAANQYVLTSDARLSDSRNPLPGSASYIQNQDAAPQPASDFYIGGIGKASIFDASFGYYTTGGRILGSTGANSSNLFVGVNAGGLNTTGSSNTFAGTSAGYSNISGVGSSYFGFQSGRNATGGYNSYFGLSSGQSTTTGERNSFFGANAGFSNAVGNDNSFIGFQAGISNISGERNTFLGNGAGSSNTTGSSNTVLGAGAGLLQPNLSNATAIGSRAVVSQNNSMILGSINGVGGSTLDTNVGIGTTAPTERLHVVGNGLFTGNLNVGGTISGNVSAAGITGILGPANGGTGVSSTGAAGNFLRSNGTVWSSSAITPTDIPAGNAFYIQNGTTPQGASNFNISGSGTVGGILSGGTVNAATQYNIGGNRVLSVSGAGNLFAGISSGQANTTGFYNTFFGYRSGAINTGGSQNSFFGNVAGRLNTTGEANSFFGNFAGEANTTGAFNAFFGHSAGYSNTTGENNAFYGSAAGYANTTGAFNAFFGGRAGRSNTTGNSNTLIGFGSDVGAGNLTNATAIGVSAFVTQSNSLVLGSINGINGATADTRVGIGVTAPEQSLHVNGTEVLSTGSQSGFKFRERGSTTSADDWVLFSEAGIGRIWRFGAGDILTFTSTGLVGINNLGAAGATSLCRNASNQISICSSSLRYKTNIAQFSEGMSFVRQLLPISFDWKAGGMKDVGFSAEDVAKIDPRFVTYNVKGEVEGVKYDRIGVVLINAVKEQQAQIEKQQASIELQQKQNDELRKQVETLRAVVCSIKADAEICETKEK